MKLVILGSGGHLPLPRPLCSCPVCSEARQKGIPFRRTGSSLFVEPILIDTPEEIVHQLEREQIRELKYVLYTGCHPAHIHGVRVFEHLPPSKKPIKVFIPENATERFEKRCQHLWFFKDRKFIKIEKYYHKRPIKLGNLIITPIDFRRKDHITHGFLIEENKSKIFYAPCSIFQMKTDKIIKNCDVAILEFGWLGPTKKIRKNAPPESVVHNHISFEEMIELAKKIKPKKLLVTHVDGIHHKEKISHIALCELGRKYGFEVAYDGLRLLF